MNQITTAIVSTLASLVTLSGAGAQQRAVRVLIPFDFSAAGAHLPAGTYTIATQDGLISITKNGSVKSAFVRAIPVFDHLPEDSKVIFSKYGDQRYLRKILCPEFNMNLELLPSKPEIEARAQTVSNSGN